MYPLDTQIDDVKWEKMMLGIKVLCNVFRSPVGAVRREASIDLRILISSDWRSMGVTPRLDDCIAHQVRMVPTGGQII